MRGPAQRVPSAHPIRRIKALADEELRKLSPVFDDMYSDRGRPSIPPELLLEACLLIALLVRMAKQAARAVPGAPQWRLPHQGPSGQRGADTPSPSSSGRFAQSRPT
jgi:hypothetical protein